MDIDAYEIYPLKGMKELLSRKKRGAKQSTFTDKI
jgi:hypothetical protein